jgi:hypothetical protein
MGADFNAFLGIGKRFRSKEEAVEFIASEAYLSDEQADLLMDNEYVEDLDVEIRCLDHYSCDDYFVGFEVGGDNVESLNDSVCAADQAWKETFPHIQARVIHTVIYS